MKLKPTEIHVPSTRRAVDSAKVAELAASIQDIGLINPITVNADNVLIAGAHRLEACKLLGWVDVECNIVDLDTLHAQLVEIDENLIRAELHYIDRGEVLAKRKAIYETLHPETIARNKTGHTSNYKSSTAESAPEDTPSFVRDASAKTGVSSRVIHEEIQIANSLDPITKNAVRAMDLPKTEALKLAQMDSEKHNPVIQKLQSGEAKNVAVAELIKFG